MLSQDKLATCKNTRKIASETLAATLRNLLSHNGHISEIFFCNTWLKKLQQHESIFPEGWYSPPPHGIGVLFGSSLRNSRHNYKTLRPREMWPKNDNTLDQDEGMAYLFASPVDKHTGIIGDFGLTIYLGKKQHVKTHLQQCMNINKQIFDFIEVGKSFSEVYRFAEQLLAKIGFINEVTSKTDPMGKDYGHTIPTIHEDWSDRENVALKNWENDWDQVENMINKKRVFVNTTEQMAFMPGMAITLEPRLTALHDPNIPMGSFHTIVAINDDGTKELLTNFDEIFNLVGMNYMLN